MSNGNPAVTRSQYPWILLKTVSRLAIVAKKVPARCLDYLAIVVIVVSSNILWYNFSQPPITANIGFNIYPLRALSNSLYLVNIYAWPASYIPPAFDLSNNVLYALVFLVSSGSYGLALFVSNVIWEIFGAFSLYYLSQLLMLKYGLSKFYSLFGVLFLSFNEEIVMGVQFDLYASMLLILIALVYLSMIRSNYYSLLLGFYSFFLLGSFPAISLAFSEEAAFTITGIFAFSVLSRSTKGKRGAFKQLAKSGLLSTGSMILGNMYLLIPFLSVSSLYLTSLTATHPTYAFDFSFDKIETLPNALRLINNWAVQVPQYAQPWMSQYLSNPFIQTFLYIVPGMALSSVLFFKRRVEFALYGLMLLVIFLSKANNPPLGELFVWMVSSVPALRIFYNGATFSPALISLYSLLSVYTVSKLNTAILGVAAKRGASYTGTLRRMIPAILFPALLLSLLLVSVFPMLSPMLTQGSPTTPLVSSLPSYYMNASRFLYSFGPHDPVIVFPSVNTFNSNQIANTTWYNGVNIYPAIIQNPSVSSIYPLNYVEGRGDAVKILNFTYSIDDNSYLSTNNYFGNPNYGSNSSLITWSPYLSGDRAISSSSDSNDTLFLLNSSHYNPGGHWVIGRLSTPLNLTGVGYAIIEYKLVNVNPIDLQLGLFQPDGAGRWYTVPDFFQFHSGPFDATAVSLENPTARGGAELGNISAIVLNYQPPPQTIGVGQVDIHLLTFYTGGNTAELIARDLNILGVKYAYVDTSITSSPNVGHVGNYYNNLFMKSNYFTREFHQGTITIYRNTLYEGLFSTTNSVRYYSNDSDLYRELYYDLSASGLAFVRTGTDVGSRLTSNVKAVISDYQMVSPTNYLLNVKANGSFILDFKVGYNPQWVALANGRSALPIHLELNGFSNGWFVPSNTATLQITFVPQSPYIIYEPVLISIPFLMGIVFCVWRLTAKRNFHQSPLEKEPF